MYEILSMRKYGMLRYTWIAFPHFIKLNKKTLRCQTFKSAAAYTCLKIKRVGWDLLDCNWKKVGYVTIVCPLFQNLFLREWRDEDDDDDNHNDDEEEKHDEESNDGVYHIFEAHLSKRTWVWCGS